MIAKIANFEVNPEHLESALELIRQFTFVVHYSEPGTKIYLSFQDKENEYQFKHIMLFDSKGAEEAHKNSTNTKDFLESLYPVCKKSPIFEEFNFIGGI